MESLRGNVSGQIEALRVIVELEPENAEAGRLLQQAESAH
jgi:hypothetical protein